MHDVIFQKACELSVKSCEACELSVKYRNFSRPRGTGRVASAQVPSRRPSVLLCQWLAAFGSLGPGTDEDSCCGCTRQGKEDDPGATWALVHALFW